MSHRPSVVLTNDDGIDAPGLAALRDHLRARDDVGDVTVVAPAEDESGVGVSRSWVHDGLAVDERSAGYAVAGTPADCVAVAVEALGLDPDAVVSGPNDGPNFGAHVLARSGTIGAAMEAALLGYPAVAVSIYHLEEAPPVAVTREDFALANEVTANLLCDFLAGEVFPEADYLNVNVPATGEVETVTDAEADADDGTDANAGTDGGDPAAGGDPVAGNDPVAWEGPPLRITRPSREYEVDFEGDPEAVLDAESEAVVELRDRFWREFLDLDVADPSGTDRRACVDGEVSVSPLTVPATAAPDRVGEELPGR